MVTGYFNEGINYIYVICILIENFQCKNLLCYIIFAKDVLDSTTNFPHKINILIMYLFYFYNYDIMIYDISTSDET